MQWNINRTLLPLLPKQFEVFNDKMYLRKRAAPNCTHGNQSRASRDFSAQQEYLPLPGDVQGRQSGCVSPQVEDQKGVSQRRRKRRLGTGSWIAKLVPVSRTEMLTARVKVLASWGRYHGGRRPSSDDSFHSPTVIPPSALDKSSIMKSYHRR